MSEAWIGLLGSAVVALISFLGVRYTAQKGNDTLLAKLDKQSELADQRLDGKLEKYQAVTDAKIETLTTEVRKHNGFAEKIPVLETRISALERQRQA